MGEDKKIDITSTAVEKSIELVKGFIEKLLGSTIEETGLLIADNIKLIRFKNQIKILGKAQKIVEQSNINIKQISLKTLVPLLEYSSLEDNETLQDKWVNLIVNCVDSEQTYNNSIFPFILSQLSVDEVTILEDLYDYRTTSVIPVHKSDIDVNSIIASNLIRLGLAEIALTVKVNSRNTRPSIFTSNQKVNKNRLQITELGVMFFESCSPKQ